MNISKRVFSFVVKYHFYNRLVIKGDQSGKVRTTISRMIRRMAMQVHFLELFCNTLASWSWSVPLLTNELACATWLSISFNCCPCASTSAAMSRKIWCSSIKFFSISFTASCLSWISDMVSIICPLPCSWIAFWRNDSLSPLDIKFSIRSSSAFSPVTVKYLLKT